ncbi:putative ochratoxin a non-ribosomal peptide synthetase protein [Botrytis fragariae]|uniref:Putative ochratoxin a non-ribosomal peptide synthetase protein n=1 Tax=Botrytis fragariae TaxID=1964551 RepID=A0A8H6AQK6_9HELO|nr:putative ochratoxin a non-ribosomal peptide synthetase protein [Botrytis fragariae]KAF5872006.1 putative ochratoxin a non-ribosomal peptide synthetase protein [Botrytis fragariae]
MANIVNGLAWLLVEQLDGPGSYGAHAEVLAYVSANDVRYSALVLAANKSDYTVRTLTVVSVLIKCTDMLMLLRYLHTSGSTGLPKPLIWIHETCTQILNANGCQAPGEIPSVNTLISGKRIIVTLPPFHGALLAQLLVGAIPYGNFVIAPVASPIPTAQGVVDALKQSPADVAILVPSVVAESAHNDELLDYCAANLKTIIKIGGDLP